MKCPSFSCEDFKVENIKSSNTSKYSITSKSPSFKFLLLEKLLAN